MIFDKKIIAKNFSRGAENYDEAAQIQKDAAKKLITLASHFIKKDSQILDLGCGSSFVAKEILQREVENIFEIDLSMKMLESWINRPENIFPIQGDIENLPFRKNSFDLITSSFALHWLNDFEKFFTEIFSLLKENGVLAFCLPTNNSLHELRSAEVFRFNEFPQSSHLESLLKKINFCEKKIYHETIKQEFISGYEALKFLKKIGGNYQNSVSKIIGKKELDQFNKFCLKNSGSDNKSFSISWNISYFIFSNQ